MLDQVFWRPLLAWSDRFKLESIESDTAPSSWLLNFWQRSALLVWLRRKLFLPVSNTLAHLFDRPVQGPIQTGAVRQSDTWMRRLPGWLAGAVVLYLCGQAAVMLGGLSLANWGRYCWVY